jgi:hypothetical protein
MINIKSCTIWHHRTLIINDYFKCIFVRLTLLLGLLVTLDHIGIVHICIAEEVTSGVFTNSLKDCDNDLFICWTLSIVQVYTSYT